MLYGPYSKHATTPERSLMYTRLYAHVGGRWLHKEED